MATFNIDEALMKSGTEGFIKALVDAAKQTQKEFGIFASVTLGQAACESAWGKSAVADTNKNLFGIKYSSSYKPAPNIVVQAAGKKCPAHEQGGAIYYAYYQSYGDSIYDHGYFLKINPRYTKHGVFEAKDPFSQMDAICAAGYAEVGGQYAKTVNDIIRKYNLTQYDDLTGFTGATMATSLSTSTTISYGSGSGTELYAHPTDIEVQLPDVDHRENTTNMDEIKGVTIAFYPPYHCCEPYELEDHFSIYNWDRTYHYAIGRINPNPEVSPKKEIENSGDEEDIALFNARSLNYKAYIYHVGDGLCVLVRNNNTNILIDCGEVEQAKNRGVIDHIKELGITKIDHVILTHFHSDHVGGFCDFADNFEIGTIYYKNLNKDTLVENKEWKTDEFYDKVIAKCREKQINETKVTKDMTVDCVKIFMGDTSDNFDNCNRQSLSMIVAMQNKNLFIAGDITTETETMILSSLEECEAMIIAHHGYDGSNGQEILDKIDAGNYFVTSAVPSYENQKDVFERVNDKNSNFYSTCSNGKVITLDFTQNNISHDAKNPVFNLNGELIEGDPVGGPKVLETATGFEIYQYVPEEQQSKGFTDNDIHTYIDRALFQNKRERHNITVALMCPKNPDDYPAYEKAYIEGIAIILHEHGLGIKDLWREFDLNRAPSPFLYLDTGAYDHYHWQDFLSEVEKQLNWRIEKYGSYSKNYIPYTAGSSGLSGGSTGSIGSNTSSGTAPGNGSSPITGDTILSSDNEVANTCYATFIRLGCTPECACAIIGNIQQESGLRPTVINSSSGATGLCQWLSTRLTGLKNYAASKGTQWSDVATQCEWAIEELKGKDSTTKSFLQSKEGLTPEQFMQLTDLPRAVDAWRKCFERCGEHEANDAKRLQYAQNWYSQIKQNTSGGSSTIVPGIPDDELETVSFTIQPRVPLDGDGNPVPGAGGGTNTGGSTSTNTSSVFGWPLPGYSKVSSKFGPRTPPCKGASSYHKGIDVGGVPRGTPILCYAPGVVEINKKLAGNAGNYIKIDHGNGIASRYLHMNEQSPLAVGTQVAAGQEVGKVGSTGVGTGVHLHYEIWVNGEQVDPLIYVTPGGGSTGAMTQLGENGTPHQGTSGGSIGPTTGEGGGGITVDGNWGQIGSDSDDLLYDDKQQGTTDAPTDGSSAGGEQHNNWGGKMVYKKGEPSNSNAVQPEILQVVTKEMYADIMQFSDPALIDDYIQDFEPYSKGLASLEDSQISFDDRINAMTKNFVTSNENTFHYKVIESGPGSKDHCVTVAEELNYLAVPQDLKVEPIYPDLVIPPGYVSTDADVYNPNVIPIATIIEAGAKSSDSFTKQLSFDYDLLEGKTKTSNKVHHPVNYTDPYPYDEKITDLEKHYPKVFIDEIEGQLYSCNHPGCPISQPMAKNFAMISDAMMNQSKRVEQRLSRIENILSTIIRNQGRLGARMNINCVYYGGHSTFNKYKCIRCLHDDRIHDGELVTIDQCLNCTRFEPILGQIYSILDDSGLNGSIVLDDMQMSYTDLEGFRNLNDITHRSSKYFNAMATEESNCTKPEKTLVEMWKEADKEQAIAHIKQDISDAAEAQTKIDELKEEDYIFKMDWTETFFNSQEPDTKPYPNEGIIARRKAEVGGDSTETIEDTIAGLDPEFDAEIIKDLKEKIKMRDSVWVDTREISDSVQVNKYSSENFFFEDFNKVRIGKYGIKFNASYGYNGENYSGVYSGPSGGVGTNPNSPFASQARDKIIEMANKIYQDCVNGKAWYSRDYRTTEYDKPNTISGGEHAGKVGYDCTSLVSCCYMHAGLKSMYAKSCSGETLVREIMKGGKMFPCNEQTLKDAKPGDVLVYGPNQIDQAHCDANKFFKTQHAMIYIGDGKIIHASSSKSGIKCEKLTTKLTNGKNVFCRPADLIAADEAAAQQSSSTTINETSGTIDGKNYVAMIPGAVCSAYQGLDYEGGELGVDGKPLVMNVSCASHNIPYGTKIYIPALAGKAGTGVFNVHDTGGPLFDFDLCTNSFNDKKNFDVYVLEWGDTSNIAKSFTWGIDLYNKNGSWSKYIKAWNTYKNMNGKLINYLKFSQEDANIKSHPHYND